MIKKIGNINKEMKLSTSEEQFEAGRKYYNAGNFDLAERLVRYASINGLKPAQELLEIGIASKRFLSTNDHMIEISIEILERLITSKPTEEQIQALKENIFSYLAEQYGLS